MPRGCGIGDNPDADAPEARSGAALLDHADRGAPGSSLEATTGPASETNSELECPSGHLLWGVGKQKGNSGL